MITEIKQLLDTKKYLELRELLSEEMAADIALYFEEFPLEDNIKMFRILPKQLASEVFVEMEVELQQALIEAFTDEELTEIVDQIYVDDTVDMIEEMPANVVKRILRQAVPSLPQVRRPQTK